MTDTSQTSDITHESNHNLPAVKDDVLNSATAKEIEREARMNALIATAEMMKQAPAIMRSKSEPTSAKVALGKECRTFARDGFRPENHADPDDRVTITINLGSDKVVLGPFTPPKTIQGQVVDPEEDDPPLPL